MIPMTWLDRLLLWVLTRLGLIEVTSSHQQGIEQISAKIPKNTIYSFEPSNEREEFNAETAASETAKAYEEFQKEKA